MDLSPQSISKPRVALLIDGENLSPVAASQIILKARAYGDLTIRRVYGNVAKLGEWTNAPGIRPVHSGSGKNATDLLMTVEAMDLMLGRHADVLVLATSDHDFVHLTTHLRERSVPVIGIGEAKAPESFRKSCSTFVELKLAGQADAAPAARPGPEVSDLDTKITALIRTEGNAGAFPISQLGARLHAVHKVKISDQAQKSCYAYLKARPWLFVCDPRGAEALVRLKV